MKLTNNLLNNQNYVLWERLKKYEQSRYLINESQYIFHKEFLIEKVFFLLLIFGIPWIIGYFLYPYVVFIIILIPVFASPDLRKLYKKLILFVKKIIFSDKCLKIYFREQRNRIIVIKNSIQFNTYLYKNKWN